MDFQKKIILEKKEAKNIIRYRSHSKRFIPFEGADLDIRTALIGASIKISEVGDVNFLRIRLFFPMVIGTTMAGSG